MGKQIQIAQSDKDEIIFLKWLSTKRQMLSLPRLMNSSIEEPYELGCCKSRKQLLFPVEYKEIILENIVEVWGQENCFQINPIVAHGICIEWLRTEELLPKKYVVGGGSESRLFFKDDRTKESSREINSLVNSIFRYIKSNYPMCSEGKAPRYIGSHLVDLLKNNGVHLVYPSGLEVLLQENPKYKK